MKDEDEKDTRNGMKGLLASDNLLEATRFLHEIPRVAASGVRMRVGY